VRTSLGIRARRFTYIYIYIYIYIVMFSFKNKNFGTCNTFVIYVISFWACFHILNFPTFANNNIATFDIHFFYLFN